MAKLDKNRVRVISSVRKNGGIQGICRGLTAAAQAFILSLRDSRSPDFGWGKWLVFFSEYFSASSRNVSFGIFSLGGHSITTEARPKSELLQKPGFDQ